MAFFSETRMVPAARTIPTAQGIPAQGRSSSGILGSSTIFGLRAASAGSTMAESIRMRIRVTRMAFERALFIL